MKNRFILKACAGVAALLILFGCASSQSASKDVSSDSETSSGDGSVSGWLSEHTAKMPEYTMNDATAANRKLSESLYEKLLETPPVNFSYGGKLFSEDLQAWDKTVTETSNGCDVTYTHRETKVSVLLQYTFFDSTSAVEWKIRITNNASEDSPVIENFKTLSMSFETKGNTSLVYSKGGNAKEDDFEPVTVSLKNGDSTWISCSGGRSSSGVMPFFNLYTAKDKGYIGAIGWSGQWKADIQKEDGIVSICTGMTDSCFYLGAGESVMLPSMILLPWEGDAQDAHNDLRRYILNYHTPTDSDGNLTLYPLSYGVWGGQGSETQLSQLKAIVNKKLGYDVFWIDAGWHGDGTKISQDTFDSMWFENAGTWTDISSLYPNGIEEVSAKVQESDMGFLLWFEPERAFAGTQLVTDHPEWFLSFDGNTDNFIFNLGDETARNWLCDYIAGLIQKYGVDIYRQDFNIEPLDYWRANDSENRSGITEMKYIEGLYLFWEGLLERCPGLIIDNCASGGRRLDFEALSRSSALFRSDYQCYTNSSTAEGCQMEIYGINYWIPVSGAASMGRTDTYNFRSNYGSAIQTPNIISKSDEQLPLNEEFKKVRAYFFGDYYPLTECTSDDTGWFAYQMNRTDLDSGFLCVFRRLKSEDSSLTLKLNGLLSDATYQVEISDTGESFTATGEELCKSGITVSIDRKKDSRLIFYKKVE